MSCQMRHELSKLLCWQQLATLPYRATTGDHAAIDSCCLLNRPTCLSRRLKNTESMPPSADSAAVTPEWPKVSSCQCWRTMYPKVLASHLDTDPQNASHPSQLRLHLSHTPDSQRTVQPTRHMQCI